MNEEKYTRNSAKKSTRKKKVNQDIHAGKSHGEKLKNDSSAARSYRDKIRYGKKDNSLSVSEAKELRSMKKQGRRRIYKNQAVAATVRKTTIKNEDDNSGTDSLNAGLAAVETGIGKVREHGQAGKYSSKIHNRSDHLDAVQGAKGSKEAGEAGESTMSATVKKTRKKLMQREFAEAAAKKQAKEAANGAGKISKKLTDQAEDLMGRLAEMLKEFCEDHPIGMIIAVAILIVVLVISGALTSCSALGSGINSGTVATSFTAEDDDIRQVEADYVALETALQNKVDSIETDHPGYDEYNYSLSEISHNPFELAALLTVLYENYTPSEVQSKLQTIFDYQYTLTSTEVVEIRTRTETRWHYVTHYRDEERTGYRLVNGRLESYTYTVSVPYEVYESYEVEVEYEYKILNTTLTNNGISAAVSALNLTQDQMERYTLLLETRGNKPDIFGDNVYANPGVSEEYERYAVPGEYLTDQQFSNMHREAEKYLGYPYVWGGSSPGTSFDCSGFVSYVINNCGNGWNYGRLTANGWKNATARVAASDVKPGDLVFFQGTYNTAGASHVGIVVDPVNKIMIHCGNPIQYSVNNSLLIMMQKPDAQLCQSFTGWKQMGRYVKKGEKGISILAPAPYKIEREQTKLDEKGRPVFDADGEPVKEKVEVTIRAFKVVKTFDLSQTDGKELPTIGPSELVGNIEGYPKLLQALQEISPVPVSFELIDGDAKGFYHLEDKKIVVQDGMSEVQTIKTLLHEMAHQKLHDKDNVPEAKDISRNGKEVEAESVAYVVCQHYGINTSDYSFSYVAGWSEGKETPELKASLDKIRQTASEFIYQIDQKMEVLMADKGQVQESAKTSSPFTQELMDKITEGAKNLGFIPVVPEAQEKTANPELKVVVDKALKDLDKKRTLSKVKESVKSKLKANTEKAEQAPKKSRTSKAKEERA